MRPSIFNDIFASFSESIEIGASGVRPSIFSDTSILASAQNLLK